MMSSSSSSSSSSSGGDVVGQGSIIAKSQQQHPGKPTAAVKKKVPALRSPQVPRDGLDFMIFDHGLMY